MVGFNELLLQIKSAIVQSILHISISIVIILFFLIFSSCFAYLLVKLFNLKEKDKKKIKANGFYQPLKIFFIALGLYIGVNITILPPQMDLFITKAFRICVVILIASGFANIFAPDSATYKVIREKLNFKGNNTVIFFISKAAKFLIYITAGFIILSELGHNLGGLITGLGISSVVIALAAQDFARNIFAGFSILTDKPFEIGDFIETKEFSGTVVDITFRTTRLRDVHNQVVIIPNSKIIDSYIINSSRKEKRRFNLLITLVLSTPLTKVAELEERIKKALTAHPDIISDSVRVAFDTISTNGIDILINCYADIIAYDKFLKFKEELNYTILGIIQEENIRLAYQSQTVYVKRAE